MQKSEVRIKRSDLPMHFEFCLLTLLDAELFFGVGAEAFRGPSGSPYDIYGSVADAGELLESGFHLGADVDVLGAAL